MARYNENRTYEEAHERHTHNVVAEQNDWEGALAEERQRLREEHANGEHEDEHYRACPRCGGI